jgi:thiamin-phosphate kinase
MQDLPGCLRFYFITDDQAPGLSPLDQVEIAVGAGATMVQYRCKDFGAGHIPGVSAIRDVCRRHGVPLLINDNILLALAVGADGVHLGQTDAPPAQARQALGPSAIIGASVSTPAELEATDLASCNYIGTGPVFATSTKADAKAVIGLSGLQAVSEKSPVPVVAIGGVKAENVADCMRCGAAGGAVISCISRSPDPQRAAARMAEASGASPRSLMAAWESEFSLIEALLSGFPAERSLIRVPPGDDAALLPPAANPVVTTDSQRESVHFRLCWQSMAEIGEKAVEVVFSDLAACYARAQALFVNLALPAYMAEASVLDLYHGIREALDRHGAVLGGGNISGGRCLCLDLFAVGRGREGVFPLRSNARPGDGVYATGPLGLARAGRLCLEAGESGFPSLVHRFKHPAARFDAARVLAEHGVECVMDISDGLSGDAAHIAKASGLTISFEPEGMPVAAELEEFCARRGLSPQTVLFSGGEDYELLFTCPHEVFREVRRHLPNAFRVGRCLPLESDFLKNLPAGAAAYQHGRR